MREVTFCFDGSQLVHSCASSRNSVGNISMNKNSTRAKQFRLSKSTMAVIAILFAILGAVGSFYFTEWRRATVLKNLEIPTEMLGRLSVKTHSEVGNILAGGEKLVCALHPYVGKDVLHKELNSAQIASLKKFELPSEDMIWYLLFFSDSALTRAYLVERYSQMDLAEGAPQCVYAKDSYFVETRRMPSGESRVLTFISNKGKE